MFPPAPAPANASGEETRRALLQAATRIFLEEGFRAARVKDIAECAGVRLSAINYHFGGKEGLYLAVLRHHGDLASQQMPLLPPDPALPLAERFRFAIHNLVLRMLDDDNECRIAQLMLREMVNPTPAMGIMYEQYNRPQAELLLALVQEVLGPGTSRELQVRCMLSILSQCMAYVLGRPLAQRMAPGLFDAPDWIAQVESHLVRFSWGGLQAIRAEMGGEA